MIIATRYLLLGMLACIVLAALTACSGGSSSTGHQSALPTYPEIEAARNRLRPRYPEAAAYPTILSEKWPHAYGVYYDGLIYLSQLWADKNKSDPVWGICLVFHEFLHSEGVGHGAEMDRRVNECRQTV